MRPFEGSPFESDVKPGLEAIAESDYRARISIGKRGNLDSVVSSVDVDSSMRAKFPQETRWDYSIWLGGAKPRIAYVEAHKAESGEVDLVLKKQQWLKDLLVGIKFPESRWYWLATGRNRIPPQSAQMRRLNLAGIRLVVKTIVLD
ncbi:MAG: hypothetical protein ABSF43_14615 [Rectinemataceae bacterium]